VAGRTGIEEQEFRDKVSFHFQKQMRQAPVLLLLLLLSALLLLSSWAEGSRASPPKYTTTGPVLSVTLRDPRSSIANSGGSNGGSSSTSTRASTSASSNKSDASLHVTSLSNVDPSCTWSIQSNGPPFPRRFPSIQSISAALDYQYSVLKALPSSISGKLKLGGFFNDRVKMQIQPSLQVKSGIKDLNIHVATENEDHMAWVRASSSSRKSSSNIGGLVSSSHNNSLHVLTNILLQYIIWKLIMINDNALTYFSSFGGFYHQTLDQVQTSHKFTLPFTAISSVTISPSYDFRKASPTFLISGISESGRTATIVELNMDDPTLTVVHALDDR
jgi:hypothetical protein